MGSSEENANRTEATFGDRCAGVYADGAAEGEIDALTRGIRPLRVEAEREAGDQVDESTKRPLQTRDTEDSSEEREG